MIRNTDPVLVHPRWGTIHEVDAAGKPRCGNGRFHRGGVATATVTYLAMTRKQAKARPRTHLCQTSGCENARS